MDNLLDKVETLKYAELQQLAKQLGIKANLKADKLRAALIVYKESHGSGSETIESPIRHRDVDDLVVNKEAHGSHPDTIGSPSRCDVADPVVNTCMTAESSNSATSEMPVIVIDHLEEELSPKEANDSFINKDVEVSMMDLSEHSTSSDPEVSIRRSITSRRSTFDVDEIKPKQDMSSTFDVNQIKPLPTSISNHTERQQTSAVKIAMGSSLRKPRNWAAIHQRAFDKMDSLDVYMEKRQQRQRYLKTPPRRAAALSASLTTAHQKQTETASGIKQVFKPSVLSTANINVNFSTMYKTPSASTASRLLDTTTTGLKSGNGKRLPKEVRVLTPKETPANKSLLSLSVSTTKQVFDLKASLSKPLSYTPHKGKLKPFAVAHVDVKHITKTKSREQRRAELNSIRQVQRQVALAARRH